MAAYALRRLAWLAGIAFLVAVGFAAYLLHSHTPPPVDPAWAVSPAIDSPAGAVTVRFTGTSTLLFSDGETAWMVDGWFSRFGLLSVALGNIEPDPAAIDRGLARNEVDRLTAVIPVHSHFDHAMDSPEVARRTGAVLLGSESTAMIGRGWGLAESQIQIAKHREPVRFGQFQITLIETKHFQFPDPALAASALENPDINEPLVPPVASLDYRVGQPYAIHVRHPAGTWLIQGSAGFLPNSLTDFPAEVVFLGIGGLGTQTPAYRERYWLETVTRVGARRVIPIHWDSLTSPAEGPFRGNVRAAAFLSGGSDKTLEFLKAKESSNPHLTFATLPRFEPVVLFHGDTQ